MSVKVGVDVGGTFTKAVGIDSTTGEVIYRKIVPTSYRSPRGLAQGVVEALAGVLEEAFATGEKVDLVGHSTSQAVNALLEGDTAVVGVIGIGRRPDLRSARKRTRVGEIRLAPGRKLQTRYAFLDATEGLTEEQVRAAITGLMERGAEVISVSEAFAVEDPRGEWMVLEQAHSLGVPACAGHELTGLYGLEMRTVTSALNAGILPASLHAASLVEEALRDFSLEVPVVVMRGDGGVATLEAMRRRPLLTAFSGPAASVAGALSYSAILEGVVIEVGGTSTNVSVIKGGRPVLAYVRVLDHVTSVRSLDVRVVGVAGGSLVRVRRGFRGPKIEDVGPRSAHISGLRYCCFVSPWELADAHISLVSPRPGDPPEYAVLETAGGERIALTVTCAACALGEPSPPGASKISARRGFELLARAVGGNWEDCARKVVTSAAAKVAGVAGEAAEQAGLVHPQIIGLGGGAPSLIPSVARLLGWEFTIPDQASVISSVGDARTLVRVEVERTLVDPSPQHLASLLHQAEGAAVRAGAAPGSIQLESKALPERGALRVTAVGAVALGASPDAETVPPSELVNRARQLLGAGAELVLETPSYLLFAGGEEGNGFLLLDRRGGIALEGKGKVIRGTPSQVARELQQSLPRLSRHYGPLVVAPAVRLVTQARLVDLSMFSSPEKLMQVLDSEWVLTGEGEVALVVGE